MITRPSIVVVTRPTRLQALRGRWVTDAQIKFRIGLAHAHEEVRREGSRGGESGRIAAIAPAKAQAEFDEYEQEERTYKRSLERLEHDLEFGLRLKFLQREHLPNYDFWNCSVVVVVGQDGLVANSAKYVGDIPIVGVNPDPRRYDGVLLPFQLSQARAAVARVLEGKHQSRSVTLAEVNLNDGQRMLAFNDFFVGCAGHTSARYTLECDGKVEAQSSSGVLVATGAGSTGWLSSVFNMAAGVARMLGAEVKSRLELRWEDRRLLWAIREPFASKYSGANLVAGVQERDQSLVVESLMPERGVIFSDGIEKDYLEFNSGAIARIGVSSQSARLVTG